MLNIYYGRENINKDAFIFDSIGDCEKVLLIVPDQFTLQAERNAFQYLDAAGFIDLEIMSLTRLRRRVLRACGGSNMINIDKYGRQMLLSRIITKSANDLMVYKGYQGNNNFISLVNDFISEMKLHNIKPGDIVDISAKLGTDEEILRRKLNDISLVFSKYEEAITGRYEDTEGHLDRFLANISGSDSINDSMIWLHGFDTFTPKNMDIIEALMKAAKQVNIVISYDPQDRMFRITGDMIKRLTDRAGESGVSASVDPIDRKFSVERPECIGFIEKNLYRYGRDEFPRKCEDIELVAAANYYSEAETAAVKIVDLVRDEGMRYRDILVICNDSDNRIPIIKRTFERYGIPAFVDSRRDITHNPIPEFILSLTDITAFNHRTDDVLRLIKSGLTDLDDDTIEELENYVIKFGIRGNMWKREFEYGKATYADGDFERLEDARRYICDLTAAFGSMFKQGKTVKERTSVLYDYLLDKAKMPDMISAMTAELESAGKIEYAEEMSQTWDTVIRLFDQMVVVMGDESISGRDYSDTLRAGFESINIGLLPPTADQVIIGTVLRTRTSDIKAMLILAANEGVLPSGGTGGELLADDELKRIFQRSNEEQRREEERLAIYRNMAKPMNNLYISYSGSDQNGKEIRASVLFDRMRRMFPKNEVEKDILGRDDPMNLIETEAGTLTYLTKELQISQTMNEDDSFKDGLSPVWAAVLLWFKENRNDILSQVMDGLTFTNKKDKIDRQYLDELYKKDAGNGDAFVMSPSSLESYSQCPFKYFMNYAMKLHERRTFEIDPRDIGDLYHDVLMKYGKNMSKPLTREESEKKIDEIFEETLEEFKEGLLTDRKYENYRAERMKKVAKQVAWTLTEQAGEGSIDEMYLETGFSPIEIDAGGAKVLIKGKIDRLDVLNGSYAKVIDYKTGSINDFGPDAIRKGWNLQLMLYIKGVRTYKPAGVFYFRLEEPDFEVSTTLPKTLPDTVDKEAQKKYKLSGIVINEPEIIDAIGESNIKSFKTNSMTREEFDELQKDVEEVVTGLCVDLTKGVIDVKPKSNGDKSACEYCKYNSICKYDAGVN